MKYVNNTTNTPLKSLYGLLFIGAISLFMPGHIVAQEQSVTSRMSSEMAKKSDQLITIKGTVSEGELPIPQVNIELIGYEWSKTTTDNDGNFEITFPKSSVKKGIALQASYPGFQTYTQEITSKEIRKKDPIAINMVGVQNTVIGCIPIKKKNL
ncbi:carboxypeptidase-like regulatory domain-containing protein [Flavobacterium supellecticarium]|nr:carboxypeptidase-like regulatory domain-containing protein [Flavobacterium supellecticarium]